MAKTVKQYKQRLEQLKKSKMNFMELWQMIGKYVHQRKMNFTECHVPGEFLLGDVFASTAPKSARKMAQVLSGMLWQGGRSIRLSRPKALKETAENKRYFERITENFREDLDDERNGLAQAISEDMYDQVTFGTAGIGCYEGTGETLLDFMAYGVNECTLDENNKGQIDTMYCERKWNVKKVVEEYGIDNVSANVAKKYQDNQFDDEVVIVWVIEPRKAGDSNGLKGNLGYQIASIHFENASEKILRKSGYQEMPVEWVRMYKQQGELYGRSPTTDALADIFEENFVNEAGIVAIEKAGDPPIVVMDDGVGGAGYIDTSAGGVIVANTKGRQTSAQNPIYPLFEGDNIPQLKERRDELAVSIKEHYNLDRLLDFSAERQMTLGEAQMLENIRSQSMMEMFTNQIARQKKLLERAGSIEFRKNRFGYFRDSPEAKAALALGLEDIVIIPEDVEKLIKAGQEFYTLDFLTPAARLLKAEQAKGTVQLWDFAANISKVQPEIIQSLDGQKSLQVLSDAWGAPTEIMRSDKAVKAMQVAAAQGSKQQSDLDQIEQGAQIAKTVSEANANQEAVA